MSLNDLLLKKYFIKLLMFKSEIILDNDPLSNKIKKYNIDNPAEININKTELSLQSNTSNENKGIKNIDVEVESIETELTNTKTKMRKDQKIKCPITNCTKIVKHPGILSYI